jgi:hypothetical protein
MDLDLPRTVKPRELETAPPLPLVVVSLQYGLADFHRTGERVPLHELPARIITEPSSLWICNGFGDLLVYLDERMADNPYWQFKVTPLKRRGYSMGDNGLMVKRGVTVHYFGTRPPKTGKQRGHYHYALDPTVFASLKRGSPLQSPGELLAWGQDVQRFCQEHGLKIHPSGSGLAAQLLRHPSFYPDARRKVPKKTNARGRTNLPGNYYRTYVDDNEVIERATIIDMSGAHHVSATEAPLPMSNRLIARGNFHDTTDYTETTVSPYPLWKEHGGSVLEMYGLFRLKVNIPTLTETQFVLPCLRQPGIRYVYAHSNELEDIIAHGVDVYGVDAAWGSFERDTGLPAYASWALTQNALADPTRKQWLKPVLLSTYGVLAAKPTLMETAFKQGKGEPAHYTTGSRFLQVHAAKRFTEQEPPTVNVIQRGIIEAETRLRVLRMARFLHAYGARILALYADAVFIQSDTVPLLPAPWRVQEHVTRLRFQGAHGFTSREVSKLPGTPPREVQEREQRLASVRGLRYNRHASNQSP